MIRIFSATLMSGVLLCSGQVSAQTEPPPGPPADAASNGAVVDLDAAEAKTAFEEGVAAYQSGDYPRAAERFARAQLLKPHPEVLLNLAQSQLKARQYPEAATNFHAYMLQAAQDNATARNGYAEAKTQVVEVAILAEAGEPVIVDGTQVGVAPLPQPVFLVPGAHEVVSGQHRQSFTGPAGSAVNVDFVTSAPPPDASSDAARSTQPPPRERVDRWFLSRPGAWAGTGIAAAGFVFSAIAATTSGRSYDAANDAKRQILNQYERDGRPRSSPCGPPAINSEYANACSTFTDKRDSGDAWKTTSIVSLVVGLVAAGGTVVYYFIDPTHGQSNRGSGPADQAWAKPSLSIAPDVGTGYQGIVLNGSF